MNLPSSSNVNFTIFLIKHIMNQLLEFLKCIKLPFCYNFMWHLVIELLEAMLYIFDTAAAV